VGTRLPAEYRQLSRLRELFPDRPIAAFTASATSASAMTSSNSSAFAIPSNISPAFAVPICATSFANVTPERKMNCCFAPQNESRTESVIVYAPTIARVGDTVDFLEENGIGRHRLSRTDGERCKTRKSGKVDGR